MFYSKYVANCERFITGIEGDWLDGLPKICGCLTTTLRRIEEIMFELRLVVCLVKPSRWVGEIYGGEEGKEGGNYK
jgi:hypothetical protein